MLTQKEIYMRKKKRGGGLVRTFILTLTYLVPNEKQTIILSGDKVNSFEISG